VSGGTRKNPAAVMIRTTQDIADRINNEAALRDMTQSEFIRQLIIAALDMLEPPVKSVTLRKDT
jgi:hypothetical protein